ncbi:PAS domain-containing protein [Polaribacter sargassicola]|uniref:PAS domain-containing protein n=1 Tax=Polaribacter sargassicola TaxID=2836891 RepID=UPI001F368E3F|nr:PAS domain-containing protein [Polaribacter sp. DS7-9]MCG1035944.1 PAS domain-containing protein [Polaribacter sp. DS7-9]
MKNNLANMICLDLFLANKNKQDYALLKELLTPSKSITTPIISFDFYIDFFTEEIKNATRKKDIYAVKDFATKFKWTNNFNEIFKNQTFDAIVLTNKKQEIIWVNDGFKKMTGYSKNYAINKTPSFLQGENTCEKTKTLIRKKINTNKPFKEIILNYKKDKTPYKCEINFYPLTYKNTTHFMALERAL